MTPQRAKVKPLTRKQFYKSRAWFYASRYILLYYSDGLIARCCTCGKPIQINTRSAHCGHYIKYTDSKSTAFEFENLGPQCEVDNRYHGGRQDIFSQWIIKTHGQKALDDLNIKRHNTCYDFTLTMHLMKEHYKKLFNEEVKKKGNPWK